VFCLFNARIDLQCKGTIDKSYLIGKSFGAAQGEQYGGASWRAELYSQNSKSIAIRLGVEGNAIRQIRALQDIGATKHSMNSFSRAALTLADL
jgi:hypothetical protein